MPTRTGAPSQLRFRSSERFLLLSTPLTSDAIVPSHNQPTITVLQLVTLSLIKPMSLHRTEQSAKNTDRHSSQLRSAVTHPSVIQPFRAPSSPPLLLHTHTY